MNLKSLNGLIFKNMIRSGSNNLTNHYKRIDDLNVFPVPDGDTGSNMKMTMKAGLDEISNINDESMETMTKKLSRGLLMGARGNSGVILSQIFRGIYNGCISKERIDSIELIEAFETGAKQAYKSVMNPVEGTILTVARVGAEEAKKLVKAGDTIIDALKIYLDECNKELENTPNLLPKLKESGVIDSGGAGLVLIMEGMHKALSGEFVSLSEKEYGSDKKTVLEESDNFGYCTEFIINIDSSKDVENQLKSQLATLGDSIVVVQDDDIVKVHIHTTKPGDALNYGQYYGEFSSVKIENMALQNDEFMANSIDGQKKNKKKYAVVSIATGSGLIKVFKDLGSDVVIEAGQTANPSTEDILKAINKVNADNAIVFPNNKNILLAAKQAAELANKNTIVIDTKSISEGYSALSMLDLSIEPYEIKNFINELYENVTSGEITFAVRDSKVEGLSIKENDYIGLLDGKIICNNISLEKVYKDLLVEMLDRKEIVTVIYGEGIGKNILNDIENFVAENYPDVEVDLIEGNQKIYSLIFAVE